MGWSIGYDKKWNRDIGYGVPAWCDYPGCDNKINRGLSYVCGGEPFGGELGCGLYFCERHLYYTEIGIHLCERCDNHEVPFEKTDDHPEWIKHKLTDPSWKAWRLENQSKK